MNSSATSPWSALQQIKSQFRGTESNFNDVITCLCGGDDMNISNAIVGATGNIYNVSHSLGSSNFSIIYKEFDNNAGTYLSEIEKVGTLDQFFDGELDSNGFSFATILADYKDSMSSNELIGDLCEAFQNSQTLSISDVYSLINNSGACSEDKRKMLNLVKSCASQGKVSSYGFLALLQQVFTTGYNENDNQRIVMDTSSPFAIQSLVSSVLQVLSTVLSTVALALRNAFGLLLMALGSLTSMILSYFNKNISDTLTVDFNSNTFYVKGPVKYAYDYCSFHSHGLTYSQGVVLDHYGPFDIFSWGNTTGSMVNVNAFINVGIDIISLWAQLRNPNTTFNGYRIYTSTLNASGYWGTITLDPDGAFAGKYTAGELKNLLYAYAPRLTQSQCLSIMSDPNKLTRYVGLCLLFDMMFNVTQQRNINTAFDTIRWDFSNWNELTEVVYYVPEDSSTADGTKYFARLWFRYLVLPRYDSSYLPNLDNFGDVTSAGDNNWLSFIQRYYTKFINSGDSAISVYDITDEPFWGRKHQLLYYKHNGLLPSNISIIFDTIEGWYSYGLGAGYNFRYYGGQYQICESIPQDRAITIPDISVEKLVTILAIIGVSVAAIAATVTITGKILAKRSTAKRLQTVQNLNAKRDAYLADPSNNTKYLDYYKSARRYNLKAKILGWKTYDPINNWYDEQVTCASLGAVNTSSSLLNDSLNHVLSTGNDVSTIKSTSIPNIEHDINDVYVSIVGHA